MSINSGTRLGRYEIRSLLGAGGMGEVYLARDERLKREIALKLLPPDLTDDEERLQRFEQEARSASAINHPNIITIHEIGEDNGVHFIATEYVEGETLRQLMTARQLDLSETLDIALQLASALSAAHAAGIVHRDIKPENAILRQDGYVKVLDFGLAKLTEQKPQTLDTEAEPRAVLKTQAGMVLGTAAYMSPEQARGLQVDARTDVWSLGVLLYEMLTGKQPFTGETMSDTIASVLKSDSAPLDEKLPAELQKIVSKSLQKNADERYESAEELLTDLKQLKKQLEFTAELERTASVDKQMEAETKIFKAETQNSIAVLPFANMSADAENEYFCDGLAEELLNALAKIDDLKVAARTSAFSFKGKNTNVREIGNVLNVNTALEGSVRKSGNRVRITVQLVNVLDGYHLWSERYDREMEDIFDVQDEITLAVVDALKVKLLGGEKAAVLKRYTDNPKAYEFYLKGIYHRWKLTPEEFRKCGDYFHRAVDADPTFALAYFGLSSYYGYGTAWGLLTIPPDEGWAKAEAAMDKMLELDATLPEVLIGNAFKLVHYRQWDKAGKDIERAAESNPKFPEIQHLYSFYLLAVGRFDDAIIQSKRVMELDPLSLNYSRFLGICFFFARRYDKAIEQFRQGLELDPNNSTLHEFLGGVFMQKGMFAEAIAEWHRAMTLEGDDELAAILSRAFTETDFAAAVRAVARKRIERLNAKAESGEFVLAINFARAFVMLGDEEQAFQWLEKTVEERNVFPLLMNSDPFYDRLRPDPRFANLMRRVGLPMGETAQGEATNEASESVTQVFESAKQALQSGAKETSLTETKTDGAQTPQDKPKTNRTLRISVLLGLLLRAAIDLSY